MNPLSEVLALSPTEQQKRGLVYTPAEIAQQPATWQETSTIFAQHEAQLRSFLQPMVDEQWTVYLVGAGSSDYIGHSLTHLLRRQWSIEVNAVASTDLLTNADDLVLPNRKYLWISFSRSGDSPEAVAVLQQALQNFANVRHLIVSCNQDAAMVRIAREHKNCLAVVLADAVNDRSLAMTSSFTNMIVFGQLLSHLWDKGDYSSTLGRMRQAAEYLLDKGALLAEQCAQQGYTNACFVGAGALAATARESALKLTELTAGATTAMSETTLGLRHGPMSSLNTDTLFVILLSQDERRRRYDSDLVTEIRRKQVVRSIVAVGGLISSSDRSLYHPSFEGIKDCYLPAVDVIFGQMLGLFCSMHYGLRPDSPSPAGVISRVVEKFAIYA